MRVRVSLRTSKPHNRIGFRLGPATAAPTARPPRIADARALHVEDRVWTPRTRETLRGLLLRALAFVFVCAAFFCCFPSSSSLSAAGAWDSGLGWVCEEVKRSPGGVGPSAVRIAATGAQGPLVVGYGVSVPWGATGGGSGVRGTAGTDGDGMVVCVCSAGLPVPGVCAVSAAGEAVMDGSRHVHPRLVLSLAV